MSELVVLIVIGVLVLCCVAFGPLAAIWSLNTLFGTAIDFTFKTWLAALVLAGIVGGTSHAASK